VWPNISADESADRNVLTERVTKDFDTERFLKDCKPDKDKVAIAGHEHSCKRVTKHHTNLPQNMS
jgi:hypothetical protein